MSIPKEPRQKMINMMYLVLTALLALNVSVEILNAFKTVNSSLGKSISVVSDKNNLVYNSFQTELGDNQTKDNARVWSPKANLAKQYSATLYSYIENLKNQLIDASKPVVVDGVKEPEDMGNLDAATNLFDNQGEGKKLYKSLKEYKANMLAILDPNDPDIAKNPIWKADVITERAELEKNLPMDLRIPKSESGNPSTGDSAEDWTINYFHMTPTIAAMTILSKFQSDVKNSEATEIDYFHRKVGEVKVIFDKFQVLAQASSNYVMPGDELDVTAGVGAFSDASKPTITVNGQPQTLDPNTGAALYKTKAEGPGEHSVHVHILYYTPAGLPMTVDRDVKYTVGLPSGSSVFLEKMNVLYIGEDNPLKISGGSVGREKVHVSFEGGGTIENTSGDEWVAKPTTPGMAKIVVNAAGKISEFDMRIKYLPNPTGFIGTHTGGSMNSAEFKADGGLIAKLENSDFQSPFTVVSYRVSAVGGSIPQYQTASNDGNRWLGPAASLVGRVGPGTNVFFDEIRVKGRDGRVREIPSMVFTLK